MAKRRRFDIRKPSVPDNIQNRVTLVYLLCASLWILFSDFVLYFFIGETATISRVSVLKGLAFVGITSGVLYVYLRRIFRMRNQLESELRQKMQTISETKQTLEESERQLRRAVEAAPLPLLLAADDGEILALSTTWLDITGYTRQQIRTLDDWVGLAYPPEDQENIQAGINVLFTADARISEGEFTIQRADGTRRTWDFSTTPIGQLSDGRRAIISVAYDITDAKLETQLTLENERLKTLVQQEQEYNNFIQQIIASLSHDARTPLTLISMSKDFLDQYGDQISSEKQQEKLDTIDKQVHFMLELLEDTVNMARSRLKTHKFRPQPVNITILCRISIDEVQATTHGNHEVHFQNTCERDMMYLDETLISRIVLNLLSNALKYSPDQSKVHLHLGQEQNWLVLQVRDNGIGIPQEDLQHIFDPFFRADNANNVQGTGLGLSIVKDCVERHQGTITVDSTPEGSTFTVKIPFKSVEKNQQISTQSYT